MNAYFVTGTDTDVGKTTLARALLAAASHAELRCIGIKPAESGCERQDDDQLQPADALALYQASSLQVPLADTCPYRFAEPVAPAVAARHAQVAIQLDRIGQIVARIRSLSPDLLLVEGAGGLLVPFAENILAADIARYLQLPILVVARPDLGTINHTSLTLEVAQARGLTIAGFAFSCTSNDLDPDFIASNIAEIHKIQPVPFLGVLPFLPDHTHSTLAAAGMPILQALNNNPPAVPT